MINWFYYEWDATQPNERCCPLAYVCWKSRCPLEKVVTESAYTVDSKTWNSNRGQALPDKSVSHSNSTLFCYLRGNLSFLKEKAKCNEIRI